MGRDVFGDKHDVLHTPDTFRHGAMGPRLAIGCYCWTDISWGYPQKTRMSHQHWLATDGLSTLWLFNIAMENDPFIDDFPS